MPDSGTDSGSGTAGMSIWCSTPGCGTLERGRHVKDLLAVLDRCHAAAGEAVAIAAAIDEVDDRRVEIPALEEVGVQRMHHAVRSPRSRRPPSVPGPAPGRRIPAGLPISRLAPRNRLTSRRSSSSSRTSPARRSSISASSSGHRHSQALLHRRAGGRVLQELLLGRIEVVLDRERRQRGLVECRTGSASSCPDRY